MSRTFASLCAMALLVGSFPARAQDEKPEQRPTFRTGAHYVRVDAYPTRDGRPIQGLTADDFELLEDGKPQTIDTVEYIEHQAWTPTGERRDPNSQRAGFALAQDARYRVFVLYLDAFHIDFSGAHRVMVPLGELLNRTMGPQDLFGMLTPAQSPRDLLLGQMTQMIEEQLAAGGAWGLAGRLQPQPGEDELEFTFPADGKRLVALRRLDKVYSDLEGLVAMLGQLREERKNVIFFSDALPSPSSRSRDMAVDPDPRARGNPPGIGTSPDGQLTMGSRGTGDPDRMRMGAERARLLSIDFDRRFRDLLQHARHANVSFYTVRPGGLGVSSSLMNESTSNLQVLADGTDGMAVLASNDLRAGLGKIADDLSSHYVLGYYTNNSRWDGRERKLTVRLKSTGQSVRARREYRAPTEAEMASIRDARSAAASAPSGPSPVDTALSALSRLRPAARVQAHGSVVAADVVVIAELAAPEIEEGRWKGGADVQVSLTSEAGEALSAAGRIEPGGRGAVLRVPVGEQQGPWQALVRVRAEDGMTDSDTVAIERSPGTLLGRPLAYRAASPAAAPWRPLAAFTFRRTERVRIEWPVLQPVEAQSGRLLDRTGKPLAIPVVVTPRDNDGQPVLTADLSLAPLSAGDYLIEVNAERAGTSEQQLVAIRVTMAR